MPFPALEEVEGRLELKRREIASIFEEAGPDNDMAKIKSISGDSAAKVSAIRALNDEINELSIKADGLRAVAKAAQDVADRAELGEKGSQFGAVELKNGAGKPFAEQFMNSAALKGFVKGTTGPESMIDIGFKDLMTTASFEPETTRTGRVVDYITRPVQLLDLIPQNTTDQIAVVYMTETAVVNNADAIAEGGPYPESHIAYAPAESAVRKIGTYMSITDEALEDAPYLRGRINTRLPYMVQQRLEEEILTGSGSAPHLRGILNTTGVQTQALGGDVRADAVHKAMTKIRVTGQATPNFIAMNPMDWEEIRLTRTTDGVYIWGAPSDVGVPRMWGLTVAEVQLLTAGTALIGDSNYCELVTKRGINVQITNSHNDDFTHGRQAIRADVRAAFVVYRPAAFATVTGI